MDKETLSNYGWIVICVLVLAVMIALATPFGEYIKDAVENTRQGLIDTNNSALSLALDSTGSGPKIIEGAGQIFNPTTATTPLSFRSSADYSTFKEVKIDGLTIDSANYTVTEGSTIITFSNEYAETLTNGEHTIDVVSTTGVASADFSMAKPITTLTEKNWSGLTNFISEGVWTDGTNYYYSHIAQKPYVLNGDTWVEKTWNGFKPLIGCYVWTDGTNTYYSKEQKHYVLNGDTWEEKTWNGFTDVSGLYIWTDGENIYYSSWNIHYVLDKATDTWEKKVWNGLTNFDGNDIWTDGTNTYYSSGGTQYILNGDTWEKKVWNGLTNFDAEDIWTDGINMYYSSTYILNNKGNYVLNGDTWVEKTWNGFTDFDGHSIWTDGTNTYCSSGKNQYVFS